MATPVDDEILAQEAEQAKTTGEKTTGDDFPAIEFYYGKVKRDGRTTKTGKVYWIFTIWQEGKRKRISPASIYRKERGITSIDKCPFEGRVRQFYWRSLSVKSTGVTGVDGRLQGSQIGTATELASQ